MPVYSYQCDACGHRFDLLVGVSQEKTSLKCPSCDAVEIRRQLTSFSVGSASTPPLPPACGGCPSAGSCPSCPGMT